MPYDKSTHGVPRRTTPIATLRSPGHLRPRILTARATIRYFEGNGAAQPAAVTFVRSRGCGSTPIISRPTVEVMFFEPPPAVEEPPARKWERKPWDPPASETGAVLALDKTLARSPNVVVRLPTVRAFRHGCFLDVEVVMRQGELSADDFWDLQLSSHAGSGIPRVRFADPLPRKLLRLGVRYADGSKVTTLQTDERWARTAGDPPTRPRLLCWPGSAGSRMIGAGVEVRFSNSELWLWPLPPPEQFELAVEWPLGGIDLTFTEIDGAPIVAAAPRSAFYWPEDAP